MHRKIEHYIQAPLVNMGSIHLRQPIPAAGLRQISPFILLHHFDFEMEPGENKFDVPAHPHRGFMPITFMFDGEVEHEDSLGNKKVIGKDEVQWISAARGIIHSETTGTDFREKGGRFQGIQLWINLPASEKMKAPDYQPITAEELIKIEENDSTLRLVSGIYKNKKGPAHSDVFTAMMRMKKGGTWSHEFPADENAIVYVLEGSVEVNENETANRYDLIAFEKSAGSISMKCTEDAALLVCSGKPIDEPLVTHGPFVMNSETEIMEAMRDYQNGKMGHLY